MQLQKGSLDEISAELVLNEKIQSSKIDIAIPATFGLPDLVESNSILDLTAFAEHYEPPGFHASLYQHGDRFAGRLYGYQTDGDCYLMFFNRDWLENEGNRKAYADQYGQPLAIPRSWQELDQQMEFFQRPEENRFGGSLFRNRNYTAWEFWVRYHAKGHYPFGDDMRCQLGNDAGIEALEELSRASHFLEPDCFTNGLFDNFKSFAAGNKFCNIGWGGTQKYLNGPNSAVRGKLVYSALPGGNPTADKPWLPFFNWGWNFVVPRSSKKPELAYLFCLFASTPHPSTLSVREAGGYFDPFRVEHYSDPRIRATYSKEFLGTHFYSMQNAFPDLYIRGRGLYFDALRQAIFAASAGMANSSDMIKGVANKWDMISEELGVDSQLKQWSFLRDEVYPERLRAQLR